MASPLAKLQGPEGLPATLLEARKRTAWRDRGVVMIAVDDHRLTAEEVKLIETIGRRLYGERV